MKPPFPSVRLLLPVGALVIKISLKHVACGDAVPIIAGIRSRRLVPPRKYLLLPKTQERIPPHFADISYPQVDFLPVQQFLMQPPSPPPERRLLRKMTCKSRETRHFWGLAEEILSPAEEGETRCVKDRQCARILSESRAQQVLWRWHKPPQTSEVAYFGEDLPLKSPKCAVFGAIFLTFYFVAQEAVSGHVMLSRTITRFFRSVC